MTEDKPFSGLPGSSQRRSTRRNEQRIVIVDEFAVDAENSIRNPDFRVHDEKSEVTARCERLKTAVRQAGGNKAVSARSGVPGSTLSDYLAGGEWKFSAALALANACSVSLDWLATGQPDSVQQSEQIDLVAAPKDRYIAIPRLDVKASAGPGGTAEDEELVGHLALDETFLKNYIGRRRESLVSIEASGDSMDPTIRDGDLLVIDTTVKAVENSRIYVLEVNGRLLVKRIQLRVDGSILIKSDNPRYDPEVVTPSERDPLRIIGQVVYQAGPVRS